MDGGTWILVQPLFFYESLWCLLVLLMLMMLLRKKVFQGEIFLRYLAGYGLGRAVLQWFRTDKILFPGTGVDVSLVISVILFVLCTVVVAVKRVMSRKRAKVRMRRIEKDQQAEKEAGTATGKCSKRILKQRLYREKKMDQNEIQKKEEALRKASLLQQLQEERKKLDSQIRSRSDLLKNLEASQRVDRILELYYGN